MINLEPKDSNPPVPLPPLTINSDKIAQSLYFIINTMGVKNSSHLITVTGMINLRQEICMKVLKCKLFVHKLHELLLLLIHLFIYSSIHQLGNKHSLERALLGIGNTDARPRPWPSLAVESDSC